MSRLTADEVAAWSGGSWSGRPPAGFETVSTDSRTVSTDSLFLALAGERFDGHDFVDAALQAGASAAVVKGPFHGNMRDAALLSVADTHKALRDLARGYRLKASALILGITGSVGKSTVKELTAATLRHAYATASTYGNWNNDIGVPLSLLAMAPKSDFGVFEVGSNHCGEIADLCGVLRPDWGLVTNVGPSHLEYFGSEDAVAVEKGALLECLPADGVAFLDSDGSFFDVLRDRTSARVVTIGVGRGADIWCRLAESTAERVMIEDRRARETFALPRVLPGEHQVRNLLMSVAVAREAGMAWEDIQAGLEAFHPMPMRWAMRQIGGVTIINDAYNANPISMQAVLETFHGTPVNGKRWLVLGDMLELGACSGEAHRNLGLSVAAGDWAGLVTVGPLAAGIAYAAREADWSGEIAECETAPEAGDWLRSRLAVGDAVLFKASRGVCLESALNAIEDQLKGNDDGRGT